MLCGAPTSVDGAEPCPRKKGHGGEHYWWLTWEIGPKHWKAIVYSGEPQERRRRCRGRFSARPDAADVHLLILAVVPLRKAETAARTPHSEPQPILKVLPQLAKHGLSRTDRVIA